MKSSIAESNVRIINDLRKFLEKGSSDTIEKAKYIYNSSSFTRKCGCVSKSMLH